MEDDVSISVGGKKISGWTRVRATRGIERLPADFEIELTEYYAGDNSTVVISPGQKCEIYLGKDRILTGYVDSYGPMIERDSHKISVSGRSMSEDIVDCSAEWQNAQILSAPILKIVQGLATIPYDIKVYQNSFPDQSKNTIPQITFIYGETAVEIIERICRYAGLLFYDQPDGSILLTTASSKKAASGFKEGVNIQSARGRFTMNRFSKYVCVYQSTVSISDGQNLNSGQNNSQQEFWHEDDNTVPRNRKKYIVVDSGDYSALNGEKYPVTRRRALWEKNRRFGKAFEVHLVTDGWRDSAGKLWEPNTLVDIEIPSLKLPHETYLISEVTYHRDESRGTTASLVLNPPCAFVPEPIVLVAQPFPEGGNSSMGPEKKSSVQKFLNPPTINSPSSQDSSQLIEPAYDKESAGIMLDGPAPPLVPR